MWRRLTQLTTSRTKCRSKKAPSGPAAIDPQWKAARRSTSLTGPRCTQVADSTGGAAISAEEITTAFSMMSAELQPVQTALPVEQMITADLRQSLNLGRDPGGIIAANRKGRCANTAVSGNFKLRAKDMQDRLFWHDTPIKELIEYFDRSWIVDKKLSYEEIWTSPLALHCGW